MTAQRGAAEAEGDEAAELAATEEPRRGQRGGESRGKGGPVRGACWKAASGREGGAVGEDSSAVVDQGEVRVGEEEEDTGRERR